MGLSASLRSPAKQSPFFFISGRMIDVNTLVKLQWLIVRVY